MKRLAFHSIVALITFIIGVSVNIIWLSVQSSPPIKTKDNFLSPTLIQRPEEIKASPNDLIVIKDYAEHFTPMPPHNRNYDHYYGDENGKNVAMLPVLQCSTFEALISLSTSQSTEHEKYIVLIVLRLYRYHIEVNRQPYDIRAQSNEPDGDPQSNSIAKEFCRLTGIDFNQNDLVLSDEAYKWVQINPALLEYHPIKEEMKRIERAKITNHLKELREKVRYYRDWESTDRPVYVLN